MEIKEMILIGDTNCDFSDFSITGAILTHTSRLRELYGLFDMSQVRKESPRINIERFLS